MADRRPKPAGSLSAACLSVCAFAGLPSAAWAQLCPIIVADGSFALPQATASTPPEPETEADTAINASADNVVSENGIVSFSGGALLEYQDKTISAESARYNTETGEVSVDGEVTVAGDGIEVSTTDADVDIDDDRFTTGETSYRLNVDGRRATGQAESLRGEPGGHFELEGATYSTCPPEKLDWYIRADRLTLNTEEGVGYARGLTMRFKGVPIFALPVFSFPIGTQRKTGFLAPAIARNDNTGFELLVPWYWNIRPNLDATFTPRLLTERGLQLQSEFRYLDTQGSWTLVNEVLRDRDFSDETRSFTRLTHNGDYGPNIRTRVDAAIATDEDYFDDLGNNLQPARVTHLERVGEIVYEDDLTIAAARLQGFQTVDLESVPEGETPDVEDTPYRRLPQLTLTTQAGKRPLGFATGFDGEFVFFDRSDSVTGTRVHLAPRISLPLSGDAWFFEPGFSHRYTWYGLNDSGDEFPSSVTRNVNTFTVDTGLFFDREFGSDGSVQTFEPRVYYLNVPFVDQTDIPIFDTSAFDFNFSQLFRENRFSGIDRIADAEQLSLALTTRIIDGTDGRESLSAAIGQIVFFDDRQVSLPDETFDDGSLIDTSDRSDLVAEFSARLRRDWIARGNLQWNPDSNETIRSSFFVSYQPDDHRLVNLGHRIVDTGTPAETEQLDFSVVWPVRDNLRIAARWNYSLDADTSLDTLLGIEYDSCCYALRLAARRFIADDNEEHDTTVTLQLILKGLAPLGQNYGAVLEESILGYRDTY